MREMANLVFGVFVRLFGTFLRIFGDILRIFGDLNYFQKNFHFLKFF